MSDSLRTSERGASESQDETLLRLAVEASPAGMIAVDESGTIVLVNREIERIFGYPRAELVGRSVDALVPERFQSRHPRFRTHYFSEAKARPMGSALDLHGLRRDGSEVPVEIGLNPVQLGDRRIVLASVVDLSARRRAQAHFEAAVEAAPSGMIMSDELGRIQLVNREVERLFLYTRGELIGMQIEELVPLRFAAHHAAHRAAFFENPGTRRMGEGRDLYGRRKDGREIQIEIALNPMRTEQGMLVLTSIVDVTNRRQLEAQLRQSHKLEAIGTLASGIAHDFNNLLLAIIGHTELISAAVGGASPLIPDVQQVLIAAERGRQLVRRILAFSRQSELARVPLKPIAVVRETLQLLRASLPTTIEMRDGLHAETPMVLSDEAQLQQVIMNLATNAAHSMPRGGVLEVRLEPVRIRAGQRSPHPSLGEGGYVRLSVLDSGNGMDEETLKRAFDPFFTTKGPGEGTGLGLAIVHGIVEAHHGAVEIQSRPGVGTRVDVYLPAYAEASAGPDASSQDSARPRILLVEDEAPILRMLTRQLELLGYRVSPHSSSVDALQILVEQPQEFSLLITDNTMPRMTGLELSQRARETVPGLPVLLISGLAQRVDPALLRAAGVTEVLGKPHTLSELKVVLEQLLPAEPEHRPR